MLGLCLATTNSPPPYLTPTSVSGARVTMRPHTLHQDLSLSRLCWPLYIDDGIIKCGLSTHNDGARQIPPPNGQRKSIYCPFLPSTRTPSKTNPLDHYIAVLGSSGIALAVWQEGADHGQIPSRMIQDFLLRLYHRTSSPLTSFFDRSTTRYSAEAGESGEDITELSMDGDIQMQSLIVATEQG